MIATFMRAVSAAALLCAFVPASAQGSSTGASASAQAHALFDDYWDAGARFSPETATSRGDHRFDDRLTDASPEHEAAWYAYERQLMARLNALPRQELSPQDRMSVDLLLRNLGDDLALQPYLGERTMTVNATPWPFQTSFLNLIQSMPVDNEAQVRNVLARMHAYPRRMAQEIAWLRKGAALHWVPPKVVLKAVLVQLDGQLAKSGEASEYFEPFTRMSASIPQDVRDKLRAEGKAAVDTEALAATRQLRDFVAGDYMAAAPERVGLAQYPDGAKVYALLVRQSTTTELSPDEIHRIGMEELAKARNAMDSVRRETGFAGDLAAFTKYVQTDPKFFKRSGDELLTGYRDIAKRIDPELPHLFAELPRTPYGVRALPDFMGAGSAETYTNPAFDGSTPGWFNANTRGYASRPVWSMEAIVLHEAVPGHHLQTARAAEVGDLPQFRRELFFAAYIEGWALYSETLGPELGMYKDPYSRFGFQLNQAWRAARLVVDTGLNAKGWTREQAIDFMQTQAGLDATRATAEVDRYISWPAQALSYMIGERKLIELRDRARAALGAKFDIRRFHNVLLDGGALPLDVLDKVVNDWITAERAR